MSQKLRIAAGLSHREGPAWKRESLEGVPPHRCALEESLC
jgi:hypothetical protein